MQRDQKRLKARKDYVQDRIKAETKKTKKTIDQVVRDIADELFLSVNTINKDFYGYRKY